MEAGPGLAGQCRCGKITRQKSNVVRPERLCTGCPFRRRLVFLDADPMHGGEPGREAAV